MEHVEAVKDRDQITLVSTLLLKHGSQLYQDIWNIGINVSLRISDLLAIKYTDLDMDKHILKLKEQKTGKGKEVKLNAKVVDIIQRRRNDHPEDVYLFEGHSNRSKGKPVSRQMVARKFKEIGEIIGIQLSTHSMRKTRGFVMYNDGKDIALISKVLNHSSPAVTMRYLGITREEVMDTYDQYQL